jgi:hypothetical protein
MVVSFVAFAGCKEVDPAYCAMRPGINGCPDAAVTGGACRGNNDCTSTPSFPVCDLADNGGTCVLCTATDHAACTGMTPRCEGQTCVACVDNNDCGGTGVCLLSGACADPSSIIHAKVTGLDLGGCGDTGNECTLTRALTEVTDARNVIKLDDAGPYAVAGGFFVAADVTIDAREATIARTSLGPIVTIPIGKTVTLLGGTIQGAAGSEGDGIQCNTATLTIHGTTIQMNDESAIDATACTLTVTGAVIRNNGTPKAIPGIKLSGGSITISRSSIISNLGGGIVVNNNGTFEIVGNVFLGNGDSFGIIGGVSVDTTVTGNRLEFNTITQNTSDITLAAGVRCLVNGLTAQNNIIWNNNSALGTNGIQVSGCSYAYSDIGPAITPAVNDGGNNVNVDPSFVNVLSDLHLQPSTPIRSKANPAADLAGFASKDVDGTVRVAPATPGAYVAPPQ